MFAAIVSPETIILGLRQDWILLPHRSCTGWTSSSHFVGRLPACSPGLHLGTEGEVIPKPAVR